MGTAFRRHHAPLEKTGSQRFVQAKAINAPPRTSSSDGPIPRDRRRSRARSRRRPAGLDAAHVGFVFTDVHQGCQYGNRGLRYVADFVQPSGPRNTRHNSGSKNECGGPVRLPGVVGPRPKRRPPAPNDPIGKLALASVAHRPGPGRSEQVRRLGPGPYFQFGPPASAKKYDGRSRETDRDDPNGTSVGKWQAAARAPVR